MSNAVTRAVIIALATWIPLGASGQGNADTRAVAAAPPSRVEARAFPSLEGATAWINSPALTPMDLRGKVVLVDFWTYTCIN